MATLNVNQLELEEWAAEHTHHEPHDTEFAAAEKAFSKSGALKRKIYNLLLSAGNTGMTPEEISRALGYNTSDGGNTVRRRMIDLQKEGKIMHHPDSLTRPNKAGNEALVWIVGTDPENQKTKIQVLQERIKELRDRLQEGVELVERLEKNRDQLRAEVERLKSLLGLGHTGIANRLKAVEERCDQWRDVAAGFYAIAKEKQRERLLISAQNTGVVINSRTDFDDAIAAYERLAKEEVK